MSSTTGKSSAASGNYRKPPADYQFRKGTSGNPNGRPRKKDMQRGPGMRAGGIIDRLSGIALDEAMRQVTVREGDKVTEIPALQALIRTMFRAAAQGNIKAASQLMPLIAQAESARIETASQILKEAFRHKDKYTALFDQHDSDGLDPPDVHPHPDDLVIDGATGEVTAKGALTKEQAGARKAVRAQALAYLRRYWEVKEELEKDPGNQALKREYKELHIHHRFLEEDAELIVHRKAMRMSRRGESLEDPPATRGKSRTKQ